MDAKNPQAHAILKVTLFCVVFTLLLIVFSFGKNFLPPSMERLAHGCLGIVAGFIATILFLKYDRKSFAAINLRLTRKTPIHFLSGFLIGLLLMGSLSLFVMYTSGVTICKNPGSDLFRFLGMSIALLPLAFMEEIGFRAYPLETLKDKTSVLATLIITSILFAIYHIANGWSVQASFLGPGVWGLIFGLAALQSKGIAMPTGLHYAANLVPLAFAGEENAYSLWRMKMSEASAGFYAGNSWMEILPSIFLVIVAGVWFGFSRRPPREKAK